VQAISSLSKTVSVFTTTFDYLQRSTHDEDAKPELARLWARDILTNIGVSVEVRGSPSPRTPLLLVGNHLSYLDIPLLMGFAPNISFVAKEEVGRWPVIGAGARALNTIFVKRSCAKERALARAALGRELAGGKRIAVFPAGTTCMFESKPWRKGAFEIAKEFGIPIQPFRIRYTPARRAAYIGRDFFPLHLFRLAQAGGVKAKIEFHPSVQVDDVEESTSTWRSWSQTFEW
jgi:1-acyl-sn-glycerol-3-phosphate acyltransferase